MFTGRYSVIPGSGEINQPSTSESMAATFRADYMAPFLLTPGMEEGKRKQLGQNVAILQAEASKGNQGYLQGGANWLAGMAGSILNPYSLATGEIAGIGLRAASPYVSAFTGKYLGSQGTALLSRPVTDILGARAPSFLEKETIGSLGRKVVSGYAQGTAFSLPGEIANTYDPSSDKFNWWGGIKAASGDGGVGLLLMSAPYLGGIVWNKFFRGAADHSEMPLPGEKSPITQEHIDRAVSDRLLSPDEGKWFSDYLFRGDTNENLATRATEMLIKNGHPVDAATNQVMFKILHPDDVANLHTAVADRLASTIPDSVKNSFADFITNNSIDKMRANPQSVVDGLNGVVNFVRKRIEKAPDEVVDFNRIMRRLLPENLKEDNPFTQAKMARTLRSGENTGLTVPHQVEKRLKAEEKIRRLRQRLSDYRKQAQITGKSEYRKLVARTEERISYHTSQLKPLLSHENEMKYIRKKLLPDGNVAKNFKSMREYNRLMDLTRVRNSARLLMHELHLRHEHEMQEAHANVLDSLAKIMRSEFGKFARPEDINNYMKERMKDQVPEFKNLEIESVKKEMSEDRKRIEKVSEIARTPEGREKMVADLDNEIRNTGAMDIKDEYREVKDQYSEFRDSQNVFANFMRCVIGGMNG